ncbi:MAG: c-type cytochrome [Gemmatimonadaceae bacterium]
MAFQSRLCLGLRLAALTLAGVSCRDSAADAERNAAPLTPVMVATAAVSDSVITDSTVRASVRRGRALVSAPRESLPEHAGNSLRCVSCHLDNGRRTNAMTWIGVYARFPQYRSRSGTVIRLEDRINDCIMRSLDGRALSYDSRDMRDIVAYMAFLSQGVPVGAEVRGQGLPRLDPLVGDTTKGLTVFRNTCSACHGQNGEGTVEAPPLWGPESYNIGAGMARVRTAASFIRHNMPFDNPGTLTDQEAFDVATYINTRPRPDFAGKERDWPRGDPPPDVAYKTDSAVKPRD